MLYTQPLRRLLLAGVVAASLRTGLAQTKIDLRTQGKSIDFTGAAATSPVQAGTTLPATCIVGQFFFKTNAASGANLFLCSATNIWAAGTATQALRILNSGTLVGLQNSVNFQAGTGIAEVLSDNGSGIDVQHAVDTAVIQTKPGAQSGGAILCASPTATSTSTFTCNMTPSLTAYTLGMMLHWMPNANGLSGALTLNVDTLGAVPVKSADGVSNPSAGSIVAGAMYPLFYDGSVFRLPAAGTTVNPPSMVQTNQANTYTAGDQNFTAAASFEVPVQTNATAAVDGRLAYDSTNQNMHARTRGADGIVGIFAGTPTNGDCIKANVTSNSVQLVGAGAPCGSGGGGALNAFSPTVFYQTQMLAGVTVTQSNTLLAQTGTLPALAAGQCYAYYFELYPSSGSWTNSQPRIWFGTAPGTTGDHLRLTTPTSTGPYQGSGRICNNNGSQTAQTFTGYPVFTQSAGGYALAATGAQNATLTTLRIGLTADSNAADFTIIPIEFRVWSEGW